jgi:hypothetical protein
LAQATPLPVFVVYDDETDGCSSEFVDVFASTHEQQAYEEEQQESAKAPKCFSKPTFSAERPTVGVYSLTNEKKPGNERISVCVSRTSDTTFSEEATDFAFPHGPVIHADRSIKLTNEMSTRLPLYYVFLKKSCTTMMRNPR